MNRSNRSNFILRQISIALVIGIVIGGCNKTNNNPPPPPAESPAQKAPEATPPTAISDPATTAPLTLVDFKIEKNQSGKLVVKGNATNSSTNKIPYAIATFKLLDKNNKEIGETSAGVNNLEAQFSWAFEAPIAEGSATSATFAGFSFKPKE